VNPQKFLQEFGAVANAPGGVQRLREMILQLAVMGKLVAQDPEDEPASELLKKIASEKAELVRKKEIRKPKPFSEIQDEEKQFEIPENWVWCRLEHVGISQTGTTPPKKDKNNYGDFIPFIGPGNIKKGRIDYSGLGLSEIGLNKGRLISKDSALMVCIGGSIGTLAINDIAISCNQQINSITPLCRIMVNYIGFTMASHYFQKIINRNSGGSAKPQTCF